MILITGASGNAGSRVLAALVRSGQPVRAVYRMQKDAGGVPPGAEAIIADFADLRSMKRALQGVDKVYLVCAPVPQLVELESNAIEACREAGIRHLVSNSAWARGLSKLRFPHGMRRLKKSCGNPAFLTPSSGRTASCKI
jgi:uncharacterized protein YbjT (DUF2867 family)